MIDVKTGHLVIDNTLAISPESKLTAIEGWNLGTSHTTRQMENGWNWVDIKNLAIDKRFLNISLLFEGDEIYGFTFVFQDEAYAANMGWDSWSEKAEKENLARFEEWIDTHFDGQREFEWGNIQARYDAKSGGSYIDVKYKR